MDDFEKSLMDLMKGTLVILEKLKIYAGNKTEENFDNYFLSYASVVYLMKKVDDQVMQSFQLFISPDERDIINSICNGQFDTAKDQLLKFVMQKEEEAKKSFPTMTYIDVINITIQIVNGILSEMEVAPDESD